MIMSIQLNRALDSFVSIAILVLSLSLAGATALVAV
jgi:hypothetical protein